ncbi:MAG: thioredoxin [Bacteroidota bacterium]
MTEFPLAEPRTDAERAVADTVARGGIEVVVFWADWCGNSISQLERGLADAIREHDDVGFTFVSLWASGASGEATLREHGIPERASVLAQPGVGQEAPKEDRDMRFLGLPVTWIPTTWVFRQGRLATAFNYGEVTREQLDSALAGARSDW